jgi:hypothetical protein
VKFCVTTPHLKTSQHLSVPPTQSHLSVHNRQLVTPDFLHIARGV